MTQLGAGTHAVGRTDQVATEPTTAGRHGDGTPDSGPVLTPGEAGGLVVAMAVAMVATVSLALAEVGRHDGRVAVGAGLVATGVLVAVMWWPRPRPRIRVDAVELGLVGVAALAAAIFFLPGFPYALVDKDPGVYVAHAFAIAREGDVSIPDPVITRDLDPLINNGRFPGLWLDETQPDVVTPQFYHLYPATLATAQDLVGNRGVFHLTPVMAIASVCMLVVAARRAINTVTAAVFGALLITSMMQVWQARYPSTEVLAQFLLSGALLAAVLAIERRWSGAAFAAGVLLGVGFLCRPDGFLYILLAAGVVGAAVAMGRFDRRSIMLAAGLAVTFPYAAVNAYDLRVRYSDSNSVPSLPLLLGACAVLVLAGLPLRALVARLDRRRRARADAGAGSPDDGGVPDGSSGLLGLLNRWHLPLGVLVSVGAGLVLLGIWHRESLLGTDYVYSHFQDATIRSLDEISIKWLSWFVTVRGLVVMWLGVVVLALTRMRASAYVLALPGAVLLPVYLWDARISMRLMWWVRRFVPAVLPAVMLLIALAIAWALLRRSWALKLAGALVAVTLVAEFTAQSWTLHGHNEMQGSWQAAEATAGIAGGEQGVFLYTEAEGTTDAMRNTPAAVWFIFDQVAARLQRDFDMQEIDGYRDAFPGQPVFLVTHGPLPAHLPAERFAEAGMVSQRLSMWDESQREVPLEGEVLQSDLVFWRVTG
jgi:4-amino-4-deoxy-L-arabinose transferase-like glycosyltransferase